MDYNDSFVFQGADDKGSLIMTRLGFQGGGRLAEVWLWISRKGRKYFNDEQSFYFSDPEETSLSAGGLTFTCTDKTAGI